MLWKLWTIVVLSLLSVVLEVLIELHLSSVYGVAIQLISLLLVPIAVLILDSVLAYLVWLSHQNKPNGLQLVWGNSWGYLLVFLGLAFTLSLVYQVFPLKLLYVELYLASLLGANATFLPLYALVTLEWKPRCP